MATRTVPRTYVPRLFVPGTRVLLLSEARKMPCPSWSLPARRACPFSLHTPGAICAACYADSGNYRRYPNVKRAQLVRYDWARDCMRTAEGRELFVGTLSAGILACRNEFFRVHDSGDLFSPIYTRCWGDIARRVPSVRLWIPTRSHRALLTDSPMANYWREAFAHLNGASNVVCRPSADDFNDPAPMVPGFAAGSTAVDEAPTCLAHTRRHRCGSCRRCWTDPRRAIAYRRHR
jgi:protein gp88